MPCVVWLTGLSASGKSTVAGFAAFSLQARDVPAVVLDGDTLRSGLNSDLGFSRADRRESARRAAHVSKLLCEQGHVVLVALISPFEDDRLLAQLICKDFDFYLVFVDAPIAVAEARDPKGLYARARAGGLPGFTALDSPYEVPRTPNLRLDTVQFDARECARRVCDLVLANDRLS